MNAWLASPVRAALLGAGLALLLAILAWGAGSPKADALLMTLLRFVHAFAGAVWIGLIWFVNLVQIPAVEGADEGARPLLVKAIVPRVAYWLRHVASATVVTGLLLLLVQGRLVETLTLNTRYGLSFKDPVLLLGLGSWIGILMLALVHAVIWPSLKVVMGEAIGDKVAARARARTFARVNLVLAFPVLLLMLASRGL
jgi:uncharacterized membrane protein